MSQILLESLGTDFDGVQNAVASLKLYFGRVGIFAYHPRGGDSSSTEYKALEELFKASSASASSSTSPAAKAGKKTCALLAQQQHGWRSSTNWLSSSKMEQWEGISMGKDGEGHRKVVELRLKGNRLNSHLPQVFSKLASLKRLDLNASGLRGEVPWRTILFMSSIEVLCLCNNNFDPSAIPAEIGDCLLRLHRLYLDHTNLCGAVPASLRRLSALPAPCRMCPNRHSRAASSAGVGDQSYCKQCGRCGFLEVLSLAGNPNLTPPRGAPVHQVMDVSITHWMHKPLGGKKKTSSGGGGMGMATSLPSMGIGRVATAGHGLSTSSRGVVGAGVGGMMTPQRSLAGSGSATTIIVGSGGEQPPAKYVVAGDMHYCTKEHVGDFLRALDATLPDKQRWYKGRD